MADFESFKQQTASEKVVLATIDASRRLKGWVQHSETTYKLTGFDEPVVLAVSEDGVALSEVGSLAAVTTDTWFNDRTAKTLYIDIGEDPTPTTIFISVEFREFFSNKGVRVPADLTESGAAVYWLPLIDKTSDFGPKGDIQRQTGQAIEGTGSITFVNDGAYWRTRYDRFYWDNKPVRIYSWNEELGIDDAKLLFRGRVAGRLFRPGRSVRFRLKDAFFDLRRNIPLGDVGDVAGAKIEPSLADSKVRLVYGEVDGHRPINIDQVLADTGYDLTGTVSVTNGSATVTGSGTSFFNDLSPDDELLVDGLVDEKGDPIEIVVESIASDTSLTLTEVATRTLSGATFAVQPAEDLPKRYTNRLWLVADHMREPVTTVSQATAVNLMTVADDTDMEAGAQISVGGQNVEIRRVGPNGEIRLDTNLLLPPTPGTEVKRLSVFNVFINNRELFHGEHYTYDANLGTLTLEQTAERDIAPTRTLNGTLTTSAGVRSVTGTGTNFLTQLDTNSWVRLDADTEFREVLSIESDTALTLRVGAQNTGTSTGKFKRPRVFDPEQDVLSCSVLGATDDGTKSGVWLKTVPQTVRDILSRAGIEDSDVDGGSFTTAQEIAPQRVSIVLPDRFDETRLIRARDAVNRLNESVFGSLIQNDEMKLEYRVLSPKKVRSETLEIDEDDTLSLKIESKGDDIVKDVRVNYLFREFDRFVREPRFSVEKATSKAGEFLAGSERTFDINTVLRRQSEALIMARRWAFLLSFASSVVDIDLKMRAIDLVSGDRVKLDHENLYDRIASPVREKIASVVTARKNAKGVSLEIEDLSNALTRCGVITENDAEPFASVLASDLIYQGFVTENSGLLDADRETDGVSIIW